MVYVVKAMCYLDPDGNGTARKTEAFRYDSKEMACLAAKVSNGEVIEILTPANRSKETKANQAWMRENNG
ncbi:hypothetical protein ACNZ61_000652 [Enterococcus hirae]